MVANRVGRHGAVPPQIEVAAVDPAVDRVTDGLSRKLDNLIESLVVRNVCPMICQDGFRNRTPMVMAK